MADGYRERIERTIYLLQHRPDHDQDYKAMGQIRWFDNREACLSEESDYTGIQIPERVWVGLDRPEEITVTIEGPDKIREIAKQWSEDDSTEFDLGEDMDKELKGMLE